MGPSRVTYEFRNMSVLLKDFNRMESCASLHIFNICQAVKAPFLHRIRPAKPEIRANINLDISQNGLFLLISLSTPKKKMFSFSLHSIRKVFLVYIYENNLINKIHYALIFLLRILGLHWSEIINNEGILEGSPHTYLE